MREIKFRGKHIETGKWIIGSLLYDPYRDESEISDHDDINLGREDVDPNTVGQYTGLKDRNGREIYEGDVVELRPRYSQLRRIEYSDGQWICVGAGGGWVALIEDEQIGNEMNGVEVVGNIYDNPELIKEN